MLDRTSAYGLDYMFPARDDAIGANLALYGEFAAVIADFLIAQATAPSGLFIDAGANIGSISLPFASARRQWRVLSVEAHRGLASILSANALNNRLINVEVVQAAVGAETGVVRFPNEPLYHHRNYGTLSLTQPGEYAKSTLMTTLDDLAPAGAQLVKIDVEGFDAEALRGAPRLLREVRPTWLVEAAPNQYPAAAREVVQILLEADYAVHWFFAPWSSARALKGRLAPVLGKGDPNVVALPRGVENTWQLPRVRDADEAYPKSAAAYPYLTRYGITDVPA